jgi:hypothetical protein
VTASSEPAAATSSTTPNARGLRSDDIRSPEVSTGYVVHIVVSAFNVSEPQWQYDRWPARRSGAAAHFSSYFGLPC